MEPAFANHPTGLLIANPGLPYKPPIGLLPPLLLACWSLAPYWLGLRPPYSLAFGSLPHLYWIVFSGAPPSGYNQTHS